MGSATASAYRTVKTAEASDLEQQLKVDTCPQPQRSSRTGVARLYVPMIGLDPQEKNRRSTPMELLYDLTVAVGASTLSSEFTSALLTADGFTPFISFTFFSTFLAMWQSWAPYVLFSSSYNVDDVLFRLATLGQMVGVLLISNGIHAEFTGGGYFRVVWGYVIIRVFHIFLFRVRAAIEDPLRRFNNLKHAGELLVLQCLWVLSCYFEPTLETAVAWTVTLATLEFLLPALFAERNNLVPSPFHPHYSADRHGELTLILCGEIIMSISLATSEALDGGALNTESVKIAIAGLFLLFMLWWIYFSTPYGDMLERNPTYRVIYCYIHFPLHATLVLFSVGIDLAARLSGGADSLTNANLPNMIVAVAVSALLVFKFLLYVTLVGWNWKSIVSKLVASLSVLLLASLVGPLVSLGDTLLILCVPLLLLIGFDLVSAAQNKTPFE
ncbi:Low temperature requirement A [Chytriomyces sp. MP71]|nr:Low temperature requirement A [Chytriomyces sp. MP71]